MDCLSLRICEVNSFGKDILQEIALILEIERYEDMEKQQIIEAIEDLVVRGFVGVESEKLEKARTFIEYISTADLSEEDICCLTLMHDLICC